MQKVTYSRAKPPMCPTTPVFLEMVYRNPNAWGRPVQDMQGMEYSTSPLIVTTQIGPRPR